jgi:hypothetical protein
MSNTNVENAINDINNANDTNNIKKIIITDINNQNKIKRKSNADTTIKNVINEKEIKLRVETKTWGLNEEQLIHTRQLESLYNLLVCSSTKYDTKIVSHIKSKLCSYKHQDITKKKLNETEFVSFNEVIKLLVECNLTCCYCSQDVFILYEKVREQKQWSLDRINNDLGHNTGNLVIACLECNLKRRRTNKDAFMFTKNMVIIKTT